MYCLLPSFSRNNNCEVKSICGRDSIRMQNYCKKFNTKRYDNWKEMLEKENPDAVAIATIPKFQYEIAKYALENNIAVFAEKPLTISKKSSKELFELSKEKNMPNMVDYIFPEIIEWEKVKNILEDHKIGEIFSIEVDWKFLSYDLKNKIQSWKTDIHQGGGALSFYFSHVFYYLEYFFGKIKNLECSFATNEFVDSDIKIKMKIFFENGIIGNANMNIESKDEQKHILKINGKLGTLILENNKNDFVDNFQIFLKNEKGVEKIKVENSNSPWEQNEDSRIKVVSPIIDRFIQWCNTGKPAKPDFEDGMRIQELIDMARKSDARFFEKFDKFSKIS